MAENEIIYTINLGRFFKKVPLNRRAELAVKTVRAFAQRHMKSAGVKIGADVAKALYRRGIKKPLRRIRVVLERQGGLVLVRMFGGKEASKTAGAEPKTGQGGVQKAEGAVKPTESKPAGK